MFGKESPEVQGGVKEEDTFDLCINWTMKERKYRLDVQMHTNMNVIFAKRGNSVRTGGMEDDIRGYWLISHAELYYSSFKI